MGRAPHSVRTRRVAAAAFAVTLVLGGLAGCSKDDDAGSAPNIATTSTSPDATTAPSAADAFGAKVVAPEAIGPYKVGRQVITMTDTARNRPLTVDVWYPASVDATGAASRYTFTPTIYFDSKAALDAPPIATDGPFPLVVYSHGSGGLRYVASFFTEVLASHGFVVIAPDHTGNTAVDEITGSAVPREENAVNRVNDAQFVITDMLQRNDTAGDFFAGSVDPDRIGITGHSFGGFTSLATASGYSNDIATIAGDPRIKAVVAMAPYSELITDEELEAINVPTLLITGTKDTTTPIEPETVRPWENIAGRPLFRVDLTGAGHQSFTDICEYQRLLPTIADVPEVLISTVDKLALAGCGDAFIDEERAHEISNIFVISFLETYVAGTPGYDNVLTKNGASIIDEVTFSGVDK